MIAYELRARLDAGLTLVGRDDEGRYEWMGTNNQWSSAEELEVIYSENGYANPF